MREVSPKTLAIPHQVHNVAGRSAAPGSNVPSLAAVLVAHFVGELAGSATG
jgi:hypothetical protein